MLEWDILSVYPYKEENIQEILCRIYSIVEELKKNGQVVEPGSIEKLKADVEQLKQQMGTEFDQKIKEAISQLNDVVSSVTTKGVFPANNIRDPYINDYIQELTAEDGTEHQNKPYYGPCKLQVKNGTGHITGLLKLVDGWDSISDDNVKLVKPKIAMKQIDGVYNTTTGYKLYGGNFQSSLSMPLVLNANGSITTSKQLIKSNSDDKKEYISVSCSFPIVKTFVLPEHIDEINGKISGVSYTMNEESSCVVVACDSHIRPIETKTEGPAGLIKTSADLYIPNYINYLNTRLGAFATINNGDNITESNEYHTKSEFYRLMDTVRKMYVDNTLFVMGNHDDQSLLRETTEPITNKEYNRYMNKGKTGINFSPDNQPYFTADDTKGRCRHIIMNSHDREGRKIGIFEFNKEQIKWLIKQLKETPDYYSILCYSHCSPMISPDQPNIKNGRNVHEIFAQFVRKGKGSVRVDDETIDFDFTKCKSELAGHIAGHEHEDINKKIDNVNYFVEQATDGQKNRMTPIYSIVVVDNLQQQIRITRSGGRVDLVVGYGRNKGICQ